MSENDDEKIDRILRMFKEGTDKVDAQIIEEYGEEYYWEFVESTDIIVRNILNHLKKEVL